MLISNQGYQITPSSTAIAEAQAILIGAYGATVNLDPASPNGQLVQNIAIAITQRENEQAAIVGSLNPNIAAGLQLDAICANLNIDRVQAINSSATCTFTGLNGVVITAGTQVSSQEGDIFLVETDVLIGVGGTATGTVVAQQIGEISVSANSITEIVDGINGWDTVNNPTAGNVGTPTQSDAQLRNSRELQLAFASTGSVPSLIAGAASLNPISSTVVQNTGGSAITDGNVTIPPNSVMVILDGGGSDLEISTMIYNRLSAGCGMSGNKSYTLPIVGSPQPFVAVWQTADQQPLGLNLTLKSGVVYEPNLTNLIASIVNNNYNFNRIGKLVYANEFVELLSQNGINPIIGLTINIGSSVTNVLQYTLPLPVSLGGSILSSNVSISYV